MISLIFIKAVILHFVSPFVDSNGNIVIVAFFLQYTHDCNVYVPTYLPVLRIRIRRILN
jgi:hypothetical protein